MKWFKIKLYYTVTFKIEYPPVWGKMLKKPGYSSKDIVLAQFRSFRDWPRVTRILYPVDTVHFKAPIQHNL